jgi:hypothetical protein
MSFFSSRKAVYISSIVGLIFLILIGAFSVYFSRTYLGESQDTRRFASTQPEMYRDLPVIVIQYFPELASRPGYVDHNIAGPSLEGQTIEQLRNRVNDFTAQILTDLTMSTKWQGYNQPMRQPSLHYIQHGNTYEYIAPIPRSDVILNQEHHTYRPNYRKMLDDINICNLVDNQGVKQVWVWGYHHGEIEPVESNMSMGRLSKDFFTHGTYGDISNSERTDDLPQCEHTYILSNYNYTRGVGEALEDHGHHMEAVMNWLDGRDMLPAEKWPELLFWGKFVGSDISHKVINPGCGWIHTPPNGVEEYGWYRTEAVSSDCLDWNPQRTGTKTNISCSTWTGGSCPIDGGREYKIWWFQNIPGAENPHVFAGRKLRNWWDAIYDLDGLLREGGGLFVSEPTNFKITAGANGAISIEMVPAPPSYHQLKIAIETVSGNSYIRYLNPTCVDSRCTYNFSTGSDWKRWKIGPDSIVPYTTPRSSVSFIGNGWIFDGDDNGYRSWIKPDIATPTPSPSPTPEGKPDVTINTFSLNRNEISVNGTVSVTIKLKNIGTRPTAAFRTVISVEKISLSGAGSSSNVIDKKDFIIGVPMSAGQEVEFTAIFDKFVTDGMYRVYAQTDVDNTITELDESNNNSPILTITVTAPPTPTPSASTEPSPSPSPLPDVLLGNLDGDRDVDIFDYNILIGDFGRTGSPGFIPADIIQNGAVDLFDYNKVIENFGKSI